MPDEPHDEPYVPPISKMHVVMYFIVFLVWALIMIVNTTTIETDPYFMWGLIFLLIWTYGFEVILPRAKNRSPKGVANVHADSVVSGPPQRIIPPQGAFPEFGVWIVGAIDAPRWGLKFFAAATGYIIAPTRYSYQFGPNWVWNVDFDNYVDHGRLPPHVKDSLERMDEPAKYKADIPVAFGMFPQHIHELSEADEYRLTQELRKLGFDETLDKVVPLIEKYAATASPFKYQDSWLDVKNLHTLQMAQLNSAYDTLKGELRQQQDLTAKWKRAVLKPDTVQERGFLSKLTRTEEDEEERRQ